MPVVQPGCLIVNGVHMVYTAFPQLATSGESLFLPLGLPNIMTTGDFLTLLAIITLKPGTH